MVLHESYCIKNLFRCHCGMVVEKKGKEQHDTEYHTPVNCTFCGLPFEKPKLERHMKACPKMPRVCEFCEIEVSADLYNAHVNICGSKTVSCPKCSKYIPKRDWKEHLTINCEPERVIPKVTKEPAKEIRPKEPAIPDKYKHAIGKPSGAGKPDKPIVLRTAGILRRKSRDMS